MTKLKFVSISLVLFLLVGSLNLTAFATPAPTPAFSDFSQDQVAKALSIELQKYKSMSATQQQQYVQQTIRQVYQNMDSETKATFLFFISDKKQRDYANVHRKMIDSKFVTRTGQEATVDFFFFGTLGQISDGLSALRVPLVARYALIAIAAAMQVGTTIPASQIISLIVAAGAIAILAIYWSDLAPIFSKIIDVFAKVFKKIANAIKVAFQYIRLSIMAASLTVATVPLTLSARLHIEQRCIDIIRKKWPEKMYYSSPNNTLLAIFDIPDGLKCKVNDSWSRRDSASTGNYDRTADLSGYKLVTLFQLESTGLKNLFHVHVRWGAKVNTEIEHLRYKNKMNFRVVPLPIAYESKYENGSAPGVSNATNQLLK